MMGFRLGTESMAVGLDLHLLAKTLEESVNSTKHQTIRLFARHVF